MTLFSRFSKILPALAVVLVLQGSAFAQNRKQTTPGELLEDFIHYALTANVELASANAQALLDLPLSDSDLAILLDEGRRTSIDKFERAVGRAQMMVELEDIAAELARRIEAGRLDLARDHKRIKQAIGMLVGSQRAKLLARKRLHAAGEYAVPALLLQVTEGNNERLKLACQDMIREIGRQAVSPLCESLAHLGAVNQRIVCDLLGDIGWNHAAPYLRRISLDESASGPVRAAAARAFANVKGTDTDLTTLFTILARKYFQGLETLIAYPNEDTNNVWSYDPFVGLVATPVPTSIYPELMTMRMTSIAIEVSPTNRSAVSLFVGANLKRENDLGRNEIDPIYGDLPYSPDFYATVFGTQVCQDVLGMAIDVKDTPLIRDAIAALAKTTGGSNLLSDTGRQPLLECLEFADRRVQYDSALILAQALPQNTFTGDFWVVPLLASAVRAGNQMYAMVIADNREDQQNISNRLSGLGFSIAGTGANVRELRAAIQDSTGIDLIVIQRNTPNQARETIEALLQIPRSAVAPILMNAAGVDRGPLMREYRGSDRIAVARAGIGEAAFSAVVEELLLRGSGGRITDDEAEAYALDAIMALRDIAISNNPVFKITDALTALRDAMDTRTEMTRLLVADILALIPDHRAQVKLFDAALVDGDEQQIDLLERAAESVKHFGNQVERHHIDALVDLVMNSDGFLAEAAARVHGALNLPSSNAVQLIP